MRYQKHQYQLDFMETFPRNQYPKIREIQKKALEIVGKQQGSVVLELPTGTGKTAIGYTILKTLEKAGKGPLFYITPNKTLVNQLKKLHPEVKIVYGRNEYPCLYYGDEEVTADQSPCSMLDCPHRVDQITGETEADAVKPCPYLQAKYEAKKGGIVACTMSFYLFTQLFSKEWEKPAGLVIDEAHRIAKVFRDSLSYDITDYYLQRIIELLEEVGREEARIIKSFRKKMVEIVKLRPPRRPTLLEPHEIFDLLRNLYQMAPLDLKKEIKELVKKGKIDVREQKELLKKTETFTRSLIRYLRDLEYSLPTDSHQPLHYTYGYYETEDEESRKKVNYRLVINAYKVDPLIQKILSPFTVAYSATIGDSEIFGWDTGIKFPFYTFDSDFPTENTRIFIPTDTPNLAFKARKRQDLTRVLRRITKACKNFSRSGLRSLVVVVSEKERQKFLMLCQEEKLEAMSYGDGLKPREAAEQFKKGKGEVLVGTVANYGEGVDLPKKLAPIIFFLRPAYPIPDNPGTIYEEKRWGSARWSLWNWRVMIEALQVRGRNVRSAKDLGVTFFISQQFRRFIPAVLPEWLQEAFQGDLNFDQCLKEAIKILK